jgi:amino acid transporter
MTGYELAFVWLCCSICAFPVAVMCWCDEYMLEGETFSDMLRQITFGHLVKSFILAVMPVVNIAFMLILIVAGLWFLLRLDQLWQWQPFKGKS